VLPPVFGLGFIANRRAPLAPAGDSCTTHKFWHGLFVRNVSTERVVVFIGSSFRLSLLLLIVAVGTVLSGCGSIVWEFDYEKGISRASQVRRRALVQFYSSLDRDCLEMDRKVFMDQDVRLVMERFISIRLDPWLHRELAKEWGVEEVPSFVIIRPDHSVAGTCEGKMTAEAFRLFLITHVYN